MEVTQTPIEGLKIIQPKVWGDARGHFFESYSEAAFKAAGLPTAFVQDNQSLSAKGILRGLHFQKPPYAQGKLVRVIKGAVLDVAVDIRSSSPTYGQHFAIELNEENKTMLWVPPGFAHGFLTLADDTIFVYKVTGIYNKESEGGLLWNDPALGIQWGIENPLLSDKDKVQPLLADLPVIFP
ncbi:MAG: dTDP-4-dehydrorhamnose 3,5-epimerase [Sphingobacteriaceae bacterium]|nr:dTDP-4-dehydrorhamnose 3,5-epimerase [Sphingobacteriaceae bacterium]